MTNNSQKQRISITVDSQLLEEVDQMTKNRSAAVEEGLRLWRKQQIEDQLRNFYQNRSQADIESEKEWAQFSHAQMEEILEG
ncbi:MAG: ribbon-helix-helix domain-containing protein [Pleurocapsa sp. MO_226.B13]|nr:ribbon-helix-helix domain-containing protein [Pleurocapsa sp. MO_226.B13]